MKVEEGFWTSTEAFCKGLQEAREKFAQEREEAKSHAKAWLEKKLPDIMAVEEWWDTTHQERLGISVDWEDEEGWYHTTLLEERFYEAWVELGRPKEK